MVWAGGGSVLNGAFQKGLDAGQSKGPSLRRLPSMVPLLEVQRKSSSSWRLRICELGEPQHPDIGEQNFPSALLWQI